MQDAILEPYGGEVFGMRIAETTQLNAAFGMGTLLGIILTGMFVVPRIGKKRTVTLGCLWAALCLLLISFFWSNRRTVGSDDGSILFWYRFRSADVRGHRADAGPDRGRNCRYFHWGLGSGPGHGSGQCHRPRRREFLDLGKGFVRLFNGAGTVAESQYLPAYALVFTVQAIGMIVAVLLLRRVNIQEFQANAKAAITAALESDMD